MHCPDCDAPIPVKDLSRVAAIMFECDCGAFLAFWQGTLERMDTAFLDGATEVGGPVVTEAAGAFTGWMAERRKLRAETVN